MGYFKWVNSRIKVMTWIDIGCIKWAVAGFILMIAKLWPGILALDWYWYALMGVVAMIRPVATLFSKAQASTE